MARMFDPAHPGELLTGWLDDLGVSVTAFAAHIGTRRVFLRLVLVLYLGKLLADCLQIEIRRYKQKSLPSVK